MSSIEYSRDPGDDYITERDHRWTGGDAAETRGHIPARHLRLTSPSGTTTDAVTVEVVSGLQVCRDNTPADVLTYDGNCVVSVDGQERTISLVDGTGKLEISTDKPAGETVLVAARALADHPAESDAVEVEVV